MSPLNSEALPSGEKVSKPKRPYVPPSIEQFGDIRTITLAMGVNGMFDGSFAGIFMGMFRTNA